jgi:hypothetical protein
MIVCLRTCVFAHRQGGHAGFPRAQLFDLMTMGVKYQMMACTSPKELMQVTLNHLDSVKAIANNPEVAALVQSATERVIEVCCTMRDCGVVSDVSHVLLVEDDGWRAYMHTCLWMVQTYTALTAGQFWSVKHSLARFFQDRRVKVSLFLQDGLQNLDGTMVLTRSGPLPVGTDAPGTIKYS